MSHLIEVYAKDLGVQIKHKPVLNEHFVPLPCSKYITIHTSNKVPAKNYSYWQEVVSILKPELEQRDIKIIQVGTKEDPLIQGVDEFRNNSSFHQSFFLLKNSLCHVGIDSCPVHISSHYGVPTVSIYAHTYASTCSPVWNKDNSTIIESDRGGDKPSYSYNEDPKKIDIIKPEEIANEVFAKLKINKYKTIETIHIGEKFLHKVVNIIPSQIVSSVPDGCEIKVRMDLCFNEPILHLMLINLNKQVTIVTNGPISREVIDPLKDKIGNIEYHSNEFDEEFLKYLKSSMIPFKLYSENKKELKKQRIKFFDFDIEYLNKEEEARKAKKEIQKKLEGKPVKVTSACPYIEGDRKFPFLGSGVNDLSFWMDSKYFYLFCDKEI